MMFVACSNETEQKLHGNWILSDISTLESVDKFNLGVQEVYINLLEEENTLEMNWYKADEKGFSEVKGSWSLNQHGVEDRVGDLFLNYQDSLHETLQIIALDDEQLTVTFGTGKQQLIFIKTHH